MRTAKYHQLPPVLQIEALICNRDDTRWVSESLKLVVFQGCSRHLHHPLLIFSKKSVHFVICVHEALITFSWKDCHGKPFNIGM